MKTEKIVNGLLAICFLLVAGAATAADTVTDRAEPTEKEGSAVKQEATSKLDKTVESDARKNSPDKLLSEVDDPTEKQKLLIRKVKQEMEKALSTGNHYTLGEETKAKSLAARYKDLATLEEAKKEYITKLAARIMAEEAEGVFDKKKKEANGKEEHVRAKSSEPEKEKKEEAKGPDIKIYSIKTVDMQFVAIGENPRTGEKLRLKVGDIYDGYKFIGLSNGAAVFVDKKRAYLLRASW